MDFTKPNSSTSLPNGRAITAAWVATSHDLAAPHAMAAKIETLSKGSAAVLGEENNETVWCRLGSERYAREQSEMRMISGLLPSLAQAGSETAEEFSELRVGWLLFLFLGIPLLINGLVVILILLVRRRKNSPDSNAEPSDSQE